MNINKWKVMFSAAVIVAALTGCGANTETTAPTTAEVGELTDQQRPGGMMMGGTLGKIKSIDGQTITIYSSSFNPGERPNGGGQQDGQAPAGEGQQGEMPQPPQDGEQPAGNGEAQGERQQRPEDGMNMENMFTEETTEITVTDATHIVSTTFENNERKETTLTLADLKADDVITIMLKEGTQEAETIRLGGFGGGGMGTNR